MHDILPITQERFESKMSHRLPPLNGLRSFEAAARHLSFTRAADELSVTPGAVSQQVRSLERALGITLFRRLPRSLVLTDEGEAYLPAIKSAFDIRDVWPSSYSSNTNEILWAAKFAARMPWVACVVRLSSYECGMDQPTYSPVQQIVERSGTLFFSFQDLDSTKPAGSVKIRVETIAHYLQKYGAGIVAKKMAAAPAGCPLLDR